MKTSHNIAYAWGIAGTVLILLSAVQRLAPRALDAFEYQLSALQIFGLVVWCSAMIYSEGIRGFQKQFSPRVIARAQYLRRHGHAHELLLAPLFCMGYFGSSRKRLVVTYTLTTLIIIMVVLIRLLPMPLRGIIDAGVVLGLSYGAGSILVLFWQNRTAEQYVTDPIVR